MLKFFQKIADLQARTAAPSAALRACGSAIFEKLLTFVQIFQYIFFKFI